MSDLTAALTVAEAAREIRGAVGRMHEVLQQESVERDGFLSRFERLVERAEHAADRAEAAAERVERSIDEVNGVERGP